MGLDAFNSTLIFVLLFYFGSGQRTASSSVIAIPVQVKNPMICSTLPFTDLPSMSKCRQDFINEMNDWSGNSKKGKLDQRSRSAVIGVIIQVPEFAICCALSKLRDCILADVQSTCKQFGDKAVETAKKIAVRQIELFVNELTSSNRSRHQLDCNLNGWYYDDKISPLCWSFRDQVTGISLLFVLLLLLLTCCCCILMKQRDHDQVITPNKFLENGHQNQLYNQFHNKSDVQ